MNVRISENLEPGLRGHGHKTSHPKGMKRNFGGKRYGKALISRLRHSKKVRSLTNTPFFGVVCRLSSVEMSTGALNHALDIFSVL